MQAVYKILGEAFPETANALRGSQHQKNKRLFLLKARDHLALRMVDYFYTCICHSDDSEPDWDSLACMFGDRNEVLQALVSLAAQGFVVIGCKHGGFTLTSEGREFARRWREHRLARR